MDDCLIVKRDDVYFCSYSQDRVCHVATRLDHLCGVRVRLVEVRETWMRT